MSEVSAPKSLHDLPPGSVFDPARAAKLMTRHDHGDRQRMKKKANSTS